MLRQESWTKDTNEKCSAMTVALAEGDVAVDTEEVATLAGSPAIFFCFKESSVVVENTGEDLNSGEVYDATISSDDKNALMEPQNASSLFNKQSDEPQEDLNCRKDVLQDPSIIDVQEEKHGEVILEHKNAEESDQGSSSTLAWSLKKRVDVSGTKYLVLERGGLDFVADIALAKNALGEYPDLQAQSVSSGHPGGCVSFLHEKIEDVGQSGDCATLLYEGDSVSYTHLTLPTIYSV